MLSFSVWGAGSIPVSTEMDFIAVSKEQRTACQAAYRELWELKGIIGLLQNAYAIQMSC